MLPKRYEVFAAFVSANSPREIADTSSISASMPSVSQLRSVFSLRMSRVSPVLSNRSTIVASMAITVSVLGSGSRGNATFIKTERVRLLIDAGMSRKEMAKRLESIGEDPDGIDAVLITHEHADHAGGLKMLLKELPIEGFLTWGTVRALQAERYE